jgi:hypothetical protein
MRIDGTPVSQTSLGLNSGNVNRVNTSESSNADASSAAGQFQLTPALRSLMEVLSSVPPVRQEDVGDIVSRLNSGELSTPQARQQTVEAILAAGPGRD